MHKNNSRDSSELMDCSPLQLSCNLIGKCHAFGYYSYTKRYTSPKKTSRTIKKKKTKVNTKEFKIEQLT